MLSYFMGCIALVRCVLVLRCGLAGVVWYPDAVLQPTVPLQAWTGPEGSKEVKVPRFRDNGTGWL